MRAARRSAPHGPVGGALAAAISGTSTAAAISGTSMAVAVRGTAMAGTVLGHWVAAQHSRVQYLTRAQTRAHSPG